MHLSYVTFLSWQNLSQSDGRKKRLRQKVKREARLAVLFFIRSMHSAELWEGSAEKELQDIRAGTVYGHLKCGMEPFFDVKQSCLCIGSQ